jgi:GT2 family glycosyltransferase
VATLISQPGVDIIGGSVEMFMANTVEHEPAELYNFATAFQQSFLVNWRHFTPTANLITRREIFAHVGLFDESLLAGGDLEWCRRARRNGRRIAYCAQAIVHHPTRPSADAVMALMRRGIAGARDRQPGWIGCLSTILKHVAGPLLDIRQMFGPRVRSLSFGQKTAALSFGLRLRGAAIAERLRLEFTGAPTPRS